MTKQIANIIRCTLIATIIFWLGAVVAVGNKPELSQIEKIKIEIEQSKIREQGHKDQWSLCEWIIMPEANQGAEAEREKQEELAKELLELVWMYNKEREPGQLNDAWDAQVMPALTATTAHDRFIEMSNDYWLDPKQIYAVESHYWIKEGVILCITVAETSWGNRWYGGKNIGSVWSNDRGDRPTYALMESWLEAIGKTLNNRYLGKKQTLWCLSNWGHCNEDNDNWARYATSTWNWERNMVACLSNIYWTIDPTTFSIRI